MCHQDRYCGKKILFFCTYCKDPIYEGDKWICKDGLYYHYSKDNRLENCYYEEEE